MPRLHIVGQNSEDLLLEVEQDGSATVTVGKLTTELDCYHDWPPYTVTLSNEDRQRVIAVLQSVGGEDA